VHWPNLVPSTAPYQEQPWSEELKRYAAMYTRLDTYVGAVRAQLERLGLARNTLVVFTSDNGSTVERGAFGSGESSTAHYPSDSYLGDTMWNVQGGLRSEKHSLYEGGVRVPLITWGPGIVRKHGREAVRDLSWASYDLLPTFADLAGARAPRRIDGRSVLGWITGDSSRRKAGPLYWERNQGDAVPDVSPPGFAQAVRMGDWKGLRFTPDASSGTGRTFELYDLGSDRRETRNVAAVHPDVRAEIERLMDASHVDAAA
jgi:arylsulfatase A-like enzyme